MEPEPATGALAGHIVEAAERVVRDRGLARATTKAIARQAGCAEGSIYRYFPDKHALFMQIVRARSPEFLDLVSSLPDRAGAGTVEGTLQEMAVAALAFYRATCHMAAGIMAERDLREEARRHFRETKAGPKRAFEALTTYLRSEQRLGRVSDRPSAEHLAQLLLGACYAGTFVEQLVGAEASRPSDEQTARLLVRSLMEGMNPGDRDREGPVEARKGGPIP